MSQAGRSLNGVLVSLAGIVAVFATLSVPVSAWAAYDIRSTDGDILKSCNGFHVNLSGVLSATCNEWTPEGYVQGTPERTIDLDEKIGVKDGKLEYNQSDFSANCSGMSATVSGNELTLKATCSHKTVGIRLDDRITNDGGRKENPGLYWTDSFIQTAPAVSAPQEN